MKTSSVEQPIVVQQKAEITQIAAHQESEASAWKRVVAGATLALVAVTGVSLETASPAAAEQQAPVAVPFSGRSAVLASHPEGITETFGTWNILGANHVAAGRAEGGSVAARTSREVKAIVNHKIGITGLQEVEPVQRELIKHAAPANLVLIGDKDSDSPILVDRDKYDVLDHGNVLIPGYQDRGLHAGAKATFVTVRNKLTDEITDVTNSHAVAHNELPGSDRGGAQKRERAADKIVKFHEDKLRKNPTHTQVALGDFNSSYKRRGTDKKTPIEKNDGPMNTLIYCKATANNLMQDAYDMEKGITGKCPTKEPPKNLTYVVDHIFMTGILAEAGVNTTVDWDVVKTADTKHTSDHFLLTATKKSVLVP
ncbi:endonuclease/exonuclease/phosphatase family protein [Aeromicrobium sp.]|nr:endonuclease/exonuclease/phosphatase family protein [Candidatus Saccharibacteria bacterium]